MLGGFALKKAFTRRYERAEFEIVSKEIHDILKKTFSRVAMPLFYKNKPSFGDADFIVTTDGGFEGARMFIEQEFKPTEIFHNGNCYSFDYKELQVDVIMIAPKDFDSLEMYLSYNDLGNFIGRIAQCFGLKYGQEGLWMEHQFKGKNIGTIMVSKDYPKIYEFLGLDYSQWEKGFDELEDIFKFIAHSKYFNWKVFQFDQLNKINRDRNKKRKSYTSFLEWIDNNVRNASFEWPFHENKLVYLDKIKEAFPEANIEMQIRKLEYEECKKLYMQSKFSGGQVMLRFGLKDKALGDALTAFKNNLGSEYEEYILTTDSELIYDDFKHLYVEDSQ